MYNKSLQLSSVELAMLEEVFEVMSKYKGKTREFGIQWVHSHFPMEEGEVLYETHDKTKRLLTVQPVQQNKIHDALATAWDKTSSGNIKVAMFCCDGGHGGVK